jgi:hypothetical protein
MVAKIKRGKKINGQAPGRTGGILTRYWNAVSRKLSPKRANLLRRTRKRGSRGIDQGLAADTATFCTTQRALFAMLRANFQAAPP